ncbi:unnamed protein product [Cylindrotheca closterium]|uniref:Uncharacterized protein n=1 Tax=Cylindrotheca closterium TaxID=2856 RepID=A0AAD2CF81_9STRA|nr:unnamed protein product [Cylindrotheca closterium]
MRSVPNRALRKKLAYKLDHERKRKGRVPLLQEEEQSANSSNADEVDQSSSESSSKSELSSNRIESFDAIERKNSTSSWRMGMKWNNTLGTRNEDRYHGGLMKSSEPTSDETGQGRGKKSSRLNKLARKYRGLESEYLSDAETVSNFSSSEWTPADSGYGAACPVCGCIPKHVRRMIEFSLIAGMFFAFVYILVKTSVDIADERKNSYKNSSYIDVQLDDDLYGGYGRQGDDDLYNVTGNVTDTDVGDDGYGERFLLRRR